MTPNNWGKGEKEVSNLENAENCMEWLGVRLTSKIIVCFLAE